MGSCEGCVCFRPGSTLKGQVFMSPSRPVWSIQSAGRETQEDLGLLQDPGGEGTP